MIPLLNLVLAVERRHAFNRRIQRMIRAVAKMSVSELWRHKKHKHFYELIYFWVASDYGKNKRENQSQ